MSDRVKCPACKEGTIFYFAHGRGLDRECTLCSGSSLVPLSRADRWKIRQIEHFLFTNVSMATAGDADDEGTICCIFTTVMRRDYPRPEDAVAWLDEFAKSRQEEPES